MSGSHVLRRLREEFDFQSYVEQHYEYKPHEGKNGSEYRVCCPMCGNSKFKLYVNLERKLFNCYTCDFKTGKYDCVDFVAVTEGIPRAKAQMRLIQEYQPVTADDNVFLEALPHLFHLRQSADPDAAPLTTIASLPEGVRRLTVLDGQGEPFWRYLVEDRGLTDREVALTQAHYVPAESLPIHKPNGKFVGDLGRRVVWPVYGGDGQLVSWLAREVPRRFFGEEDVDESSQKYINCPDSDMSKTLWPHVRPYSNHVILVEGLLDALAVRRLGPPFSPYATWGKHLSEHQIKLLQSWGVTEVTLFWDKKDAKKEIIRAAEQLQMRMDHVYVVDMTGWPRDLDPGKCLKLPEGQAMLRETLSKRISVDDIGYAQWIATF